MLWQHLNGDIGCFFLCGQVGEALGVEVNLGEYLVGKGAVHDARGVARGVTEVYQTPFRKQQQVVIAGLVAVNLVHLGLHLFPLPVLPHVSGVNFVVEVADIADHGTALERLEHGGITDVEVAGRGHQQICSGQKLGIDAVFAAVIDAILECGYHLKTVHTGLHGTDGIDLCDPHDHALLAQGQG